MYRPLKAVATLIGATVIGFAVPAGWMRLGGELSGDTGISMAAVGLVFAGIIGTYYAIIWLTGLVAARRLEGAGPRRYNWNRSMRDEAHHAPKLNFLESLFVTTTILVGIAYMIWFFVFTEPTSFG